MNTKNFPYNVDGVDKVITNFNPRAIRRLPFGEKVYIKYDNKLAAAIPIAVGIGSKTTEDSRYKLTRHGILFRVAGVEYGQVYWDEDMKMYQSPEDYVNGNPLPIEREEWIADRINAFFVSNESDFRVYVNECNACIRGWVYNSILDRAEQGKMAFMLWFDKNGIHFETDYKTENGALLFPSAEEALQNTNGVGR